MTAGLFFVGGWVFNSYKHFDEIAEANFTLIPASIIIAVGVLMFIVGIVACIAAFKENKCLLAVVNVHFFHISQQKYPCIRYPVKSYTSVSAMVLSDKCFIIHLLHVFPDRQITNCFKNVQRRHFLVLFQLFSFMLVILTALVTSGSLGYAFRKDVSIHNFICR